MGGFRVSDLGGGSTKPPSPPSGPGGGDDGRSPPTGSSSTRTPLPPSGDHKLEAEVELTLRDYYETVIRYRAIVTVVVILSLCTSLLLSFFLPNKYKATTKLVKSDAVSSAQVSLFAGLESGGFDLKTLSEIALSRKVLEEAISRVPLEMERFEKLDYRILREEELIQGGLTPATIKELIQILPDPRTDDIIQIVTELDNASVLAASITNALAASLLESLTETKKHKYRQQLEKIQKGIRENDIEMSSVNQELKLLLDPEEGVSLLHSDERTSFLFDKTEDRLKDYRLEKEQVEEQILELRTVFGILDHPVEKIRWLDRSSPMFTQLHNLIAQKEEMLTRYKPNNPSVKKIQQQINSIEKTIRPKLEPGFKYIEVDRFDAGKVSSLLELQVRDKALATKIEFTETELDNLTQKLLESSSEQKQVQDLNARLKLLQENYVQFHKSLHSTEMILYSTTSGFELLESAMPPSVSSSPGIVKFGVMGLTVGLIIGAGLAFLLNSWDNTLKSTSDLKRNFRLPAMGALPRWEDEDKYIDEMTPDSDMAEVYGVLRNNVRFSKVNRPEKRLMICSPLQDEGKSLTAINLALSFALEGSQVLLIAADLRRPFSHTRFRRKNDIRKRIGIVDYLEGKVPVEDVIYESDFKNFNFVPTCSRASNPARLLKSDAFQELLEYAEIKYEVVIIDSPAILPVVDASILAPMMNSVLYVVKANQTPISAIQEGLSRLDHVGSPVMGIALNMIRDLRLEFFYGYGSPKYSGYNAS